MQHQLDVMTKMMVHLLEGKKEPMEESMGSAWDDDLANLGGAG